MRWLERLLVVLLLAIGVVNLLLFFVGRNPHDPMSLVAAAGALAYAWIYPRFVRLL